MDIIHRVGLTVITIVVVVLFCSCNKKEKNQITESNISTTETRSTSLSIASQSGTTTAESSSQTMQTETTTDKQFLCKNPSGLSESDKKAVIEFCDYICHKWVELCRNTGDNDFSRDCKYSALYAHICSWSVPGKLPSLPSDSISAHYEAQTFEVSGQFAIVSGVYENSRGSDGRIIFIIQNENGRLLVNDMIYDAMGSVDLLQRPEMISSPKPNYWDR